MAIFQSTLPRGSDCLGLYLRSKKNISIHAPSRERRASALSANYNLGISIHAPSRERRRYDCRLPFGSSFQSTLPRGSDLRSGVDGWLTIIYFNPRSLAGATLIGSKYFLSLFIFQSTLPRGSDASLAFSRATLAYFNPRSLAGAT